MHRGAVTLGLLLLSATMLARGQERAAPPTADQRIVDRLLESLGPDRNRPASEVFKNVRILESVRAGELILIMQNGFSRSLNVRCSHCHVPDDWAADEVRAKEAARDMLLMVKSINQQLDAMRNLDSEMATVNCSTCHRGELRPAGIVPARGSRR